MCVCVCVLGAGESAPVHSPGGGRPCSLDQPGYSGRDAGCAQGLGPEPHPGQEGGERVHPQQTPVCSHHGGLETSRGTCTCASMDDVPLLQIMM